MIRQPIITVMGHVDHGKTSLLDRIRNTTIANREAGGITQHIGASEVPIDVIRKICGPLLQKLNVEITIPGLLFIDTPGHEVFTNLRKRGGAVSDLAILVVDITKGFEPQTIEAVEILKEYKTPFLVAANKVDLITGWKQQETQLFLESLDRQQEFVKSDLENKMYQLIGRLSELGFSSERVDRINDFRKEISIIPLSAKTGEGVAELLMYSTGLSQRFLEKRLNIEPDEPGRGSIIEKKEEKGLGTTLDVILYNGTLRVNDTVAFATVNGVSTAKIRALLEPKPLQELRESSGKFVYIDMVSAAAGLKLSGNGFDDALPGSLVISVNSPDYEKEIATEIREVFSVDRTGLILKTDTIGSLEALSKLLTNAGIKISKKGLGNVNKRDVLDAFAMRAADPYGSIVLAFNVAVEEDARMEGEAAGVNILNGNIIYKVLDDYKGWADKEKQRDKANLERSLTFPGVVKALPNYCFRMSHPAVFGVEVVAGRIKPSYLLMKENGDTIGRVKEIQDNALKLDEAKKGANVAISMDDVTFGRQVKDNDILYTFISSEDIRALKFKHAHLLSDEDMDILKKLEAINK